MDQDRDRDRGGNCCSCCLSFIFTAGLTSLFLWLSLRPDKPKCSIQYFYIPALNKSLNSRLNTTLNFMVSLNNPNKDQGIYYDDVYLSFSTINSSARLVVANYTVPRFYQGHKKNAKKWGQILPFNNQAVFRAVLSNGSAVFRLDLKTHVRFKVIFWKTKRYGIEVGADIEVNGYGEKVNKNKKGIKMKKSDSSYPLRSSFLICVLMNLFVFLAIS